MKTGLLAVGFAAFALYGAQAANAGIALNTIDRHVIHKQGGALARSTGPIGCTRGERVAIRVSVSQAATGARARNSWKARCTGQIQHWQVLARARGAARFANGTGRVCAVAKTRTADRVTEMRRWCRRVPVSAGF